MAIGLVLWCLERTRPSVARGSAARRDGLVLAAAVTATWVGCSPYLLTYLRFANYRTFFFSAAAASIAVAVALDWACRRLRPLLPASARALLPADAGGLAALAMMNAVSDIAAWDRYSRDEQALVVEVVRRLPALRGDTFIAILEGRNSRFEHKYLRLVLPERAAARVRGSHHPRHALFPGRAPEGQGTSVLRVPAGRRARPQPDRPRTIPVVLRPDHPPRPAPRRPDGGPHPRSGPVPASARLRPAGPLRRRRPTARPPPLVPEVRSGAYWGTGRREGDPGRGGSRIVKTA